MELDEYRTQFDTSAFADYDIFGIDGAVKDSKFLVDILNTIQNLTQALGYTVEPQDYILSDRPQRFDMRPIFRTG